MLWLAALVGAVLAIIAGSGAARATIGIAPNIRGPIREPKSTAKSGGPASAIRVNSARSWTIGELRSLVAGVASRVGLDRAFVFAIVEKESNWNPSAVGNNADGSRDYGLFQINQQHFGKPQFPVDAIAALFPEPNASGAERLLREAKARWSQDLGRIAIDFHSGYAVARDWPASSTIERVGYLNDIFSRTDRIARTGGDSDSLLT